ncbi:MAG: thiamine diphosphokinase [Dysgonamonadaceae bacterium]|jgi:thiamine pyrophosphokinase|nr:thiamine diphosphokinase [Dysgonamonadaceae bacterium]
MLPLLQNFQTAILADGAFPEHAVPLSFLKKAQRIICCDGAAEKLLLSGREPDYIVGDFDSISPELKRRFAAILFPDPDQETNDLTKAVRFCLQHGWKEITVLGATGKREDHTLGNLSLLLDYAQSARVQLLTDYGVFLPQRQPAVYESYRGQQVSLFSLAPATRFTTQNLVYPLNNQPLTAWWQGTLNESCGESFSIHIDCGEALVFREY